MNVLYIDCTVGARKEMLAGAVFDLIPYSDRSAFLDRFNSLPWEGVRAHAEGNCKCGVGGIRLVIERNGAAEADAPKEHLHRTPAEVKEIIESLNIGKEATNTALRMYELLAEAEAAAHEASVEDVHFHEVGNDFAIAYIVMFCMTIAEVAPDEVVASPITTGFGFVDCAHGRLPVPAPATANVLEGLPTSEGKIEGELCTPTGAAMVKAIANRFGGMPQMDVLEIGYGQGTGKVPEANCQRAIFGEVE